MSTTLSASQFPFAKLCSIFEQILEARSKPAKLSFLEALWISLRGEDYFPFMQLILPHLDGSRVSYGLKESKIARYYIELLGLPPTSTDAIRFKQWRDPTKSSIETTHFSDVVFTVLSRRGYVSFSKTPLSVAAVNAKLDELSLVTDVEQKKNVLMYLLRCTSAMEQRWLIRILMKEMKMHLMHTSILGAFHPSAMDLYNNTSDLRYVCKLCTDPAQLAAIENVKGNIFLMQPLRPMLASVVDSSKLQTLLSGEKLLVEPKFDGERMIVHKNGDNFVYLTRNAKNYTAQYGPKFNSQLQRSLAGVSSCILDGEFLLFDGAAKRFREFGQNRVFATSSVTHGEVDDVKLWFCYEVFDILFLNGDNLTQRTLDQRKVLLHRSVVPTPNHMEIVPSTVCNSVPALLSHLETCLSNGFEGIMVKLASSPYVPGERRLKWMKLKPDHIAGMSDTVDFVILGAYYGTKYGVRRLSHFLLGVWINGTGTGPTSDAARFHTVCKVGTGYTDQELSEIVAAINPKAISMPNSVPAWLEGWKPAVEDTPSVYIRPADSIVLEVFGYSFVETKKFSFGRTIRFPRCHRVRFDKSVVEATDMEQLNRIAEASGKFLRKAEAMDRLITAPAAKRARKEQDARTKKEFLTSPRRGIALVDPSIVVTSADSVAPVSQLFKGYEFCILFASRETIVLRALESLIISHGGVVVANPMPGTSILLTSERNCVKVKNWIAACERDPSMEERYACTDVVMMSWLHECIEAMEVLPLAPRHMAHVSRRLRHCFSLTLDEYEDSYFDECTAQSLKDSLALAAGAILQQGTVPHLPDPQHIVDKHVDDEDDGDGEHADLSFVERTQRLLLWRQSLGIKSISNEAKEKEEMTAAAVLLSDAVVGDSSNCFGLPLTLAQHRRLVQWVLDGGAASADASTAPFLIDTAGAVFSSKGDSRAGVGPSSVALKVDSSEFPTTVGSGSIPEQSNV